jgi:hypothetical protein
MPPLWSLPTTPNHGFHLLRVIMLLYGVNMTLHCRQDIVRLPYQYLKQKVLVMSLHPCFQEDLNCSRVLAEQVRLSQAQDE